MAPSRIKINFATMNAIAKTFEHQAEAVRIEIGSLKQKMGALQAGDWQGNAAAKFYAEMEATVLPSLQHLAAALESGAQTTAKISQLMHQSEQDTAALFRLNVPQTGPMAAMPQPQTVAAEARMALGGTRTKGKTPIAKHATKTNQHNGANNSKKQSHGGSNQPIKPDPKGPFYSKTTRADREQMYKDLLLAARDLQTSTFHPAELFALTVQQRSAQALKQAQELANTDLTTVDGARWYDSHRTEFFNDQREWVAHRATEIDQARVEQGKAEAQFQAAQQRVDAKRPDDVTVDDMFQLKKSQIKAEYAKKAVEKMESALNGYLPALEAILPDMSHGY